MTDADILTLTSVCVEITISILHILAKLSFQKEEESVLKFP